MAIEKILMPKLGESVTEGIITKWLVKPGDYIEKYEPIAEVVSDKVTAEIPSSHSGVIQTIVAEEDVAYPCHAVICEMLVEDGEKPIEIIQQEVILTLEQNKDYSKRYSPAVKWLARENNIDLTAIKGSGIHGRITRKDVLAFLEAKPNLTPKVEKQTEKEEKQQVITPTVIGETTPFTPVRKAIANTMLKSKNEIPHAWMVQQANATNLVKHRNAIKDQVTSLYSVKLTFFPFFIYAVAKLLEKYPLLNSSTDGHSVTVHSHIHLGVAVAHEKDLFVPVIRDANKKSVIDIAKELNKFIEKAKTKTFTSNDLNGATFTINNTGSFGSVLSYGIIPPPNVAILQVEKIVKQPVVIEDMIAIRDMVNLCLSLDHRLLDGLICGQFLQDLCRMIETEVTKFEL